MIKWLISKLKEFRISPAVKLGEHRYGYGIKIDNRKKKKEKSNA